MEAARRIWPQVQTIEEASVWIHSAMEDWQVYRREKSHMQDILLAMKRRQDLQGEPDERQKRVEQARRQQRRAREDVERAAAQLAELEGRARAIGKREDLLAAGRKLTDALTKTEEQKRAIAEAERLITEENAERTAKVSPRITALAEQYMTYLTAAPCQEILLDPSLNARIADSTGRLLDDLRLSSGTRDQLYFALRLAVCQVLTGKEALPLIMDDPFVTWDNDRTARGLSLLSELGKERQIILLTCR